MFRRHALAFLSAAAFLSVPAGLPGEPFGTVLQIPVASASGSVSDIDQTTFTFDPSTFSPVENTYNGGPKWNFQKFVDNVSRMLLIAITTLAALLIAVAGLRMALSAGSSDEASKGKTMLRFNIMALGIALLSYAFINLVSWLISA